MLILELFQQCGIFCFSFYVNFRTVPTVWYLLFFIFMLILEPFQQCGIFCFSFYVNFRTVPTVWYFCIIPNLLGLYI